MARDTFASKSLGTLHGAIKEVKKAALQTEEGADQGSRASSWWALAASDANC
jgi:hypothetical protein